MSEPKHSGADGSCKWLDELIDRPPRVFACKTCDKATCECYAGPNEDGTCVNCWDKEENSQAHITMLEAERDQLKAELATAKEEVFEQHHEAVGFMAEAGSLRAERDQLREEVMHLEHRVCPECTEGNETLCRIIGERDQLRIRAEQAEERVRDLDIGSPVICDCGRDKYLMCGKCDL